MRKIWSDEAWDDCLYWRQNGRDVLKKVNELIRDAERNPFSGTGKPEPLKGDLSGWWSRRITGEHRLVYRVIGSGNGQSLQILSCRYHY
jgi:toxin YoeB